MHSLLHIDYANAVYQDRLDKAATRQAAAVRKTRTVTETRPRRRRARWWRHALQA